MKRRGWRRWSRFWRRGRLALLAGCLAMTAAGCSLTGGGQPDKPVAAPVEPEKSVPDTPPTTPVQPPAYRAPLTGMMLPQPSDARPVMVMINNHPAARPQSGLTQADVLFEVLAEGEMTRLVALFQSSAFAEPIGPVRSIRPYFIDIGKSFGAIQVHAGGSPDAYEQLRKEKIADLDEITNAGPYFWREKSRKAPHNLYTNLENIRAGAQKRGLDEQGPTGPVYAFAKSEAEAVGTMGTAAQDAPKVDITFLWKSYVVSYEYDAAGGKYQRSINGSKHTDLNNDQPLSASNVVVMGTDHKVLDKEGRLDVRLTGKGPALLFQQGKVRLVEWRRDRANDPVRYYEQGREAAFRPGQTHIMIVPLNPSFESHVTYGAPGGGTGKPDPA